MAQLGEHPRARELLRRAGRGFGDHEALRALALCRRRGGGCACDARPRELAAHACKRVCVTLEAHGDFANAMQARLIAVRRLLLLGRLDDAASALARLDARGTVAFA